MSNNLSPQALEEAATFLRSHFIKDKALSEAYDYALFLLENHILQLKEENERLKQSMSFCSGSCHFPNSGKLGYKQLREAREACRRLRGDLEDMHGYLRLMPAPLLTMKPIAYFKGMIEKALASSPDYDE